MKTSYTTSSKQTNRQRKRRIEKRQNRIKRFFSSASPALFNWTTSYESHQTTVIALVLKITKYEWGNLAFLNHFHLYTWLSYEKHREFDIKFALDNRF